MSLADDALAAAPSFPGRGRFTIRSTAYMLTAEERARFAVELLTPHSTDTAHVAGYGEPA